MVGQAKSFTQVYFMIILGFYRDQQDMFMKGKYIVMDRWNRTNVVY